jgi:hypothetical protein
VHHLAELQVVSRDVDTGLLGEFTQRALVEELTVLQFSADHGDLVRAGL